MRNNWEVITTADKQKRDSMYADLKANGNAQERQVVKFSDYRTGEDGQFESTWSLAYPKSSLYDV